MRVATSTFVQPGRWVTVLDSPLGQDNIIDLAVGLGEFRNDPNAALMTVADYQSAVRPGLIVHNRALGNLAGRACTSVSTSLSASTPNLNFQPSTSKLRPLSRNEVQKGLWGSNCTKTREISST